MIQGTARPARQREQERVRPDQGDRGRDRAYIPSGSGTLDNLEQIFPAANRRFAALDVRKCDKGMT